MHQIVECSTVYVTQTCSVAYGINFVVTCTGSTGPYFGFGYQQVDICRTQQRLFYIRTKSAPIGLEGSVLPDAITGSRLARQHSSCFLAFHAFKHLVSISWTNSY